MKKINHIASILGKPFAAVALVLGVASVNTACFGWFHQPKLPETMEKFRK